MRLTIALMLLAAALWAQSDSTAPIQHIQAELITPVKTKKAKAGDKLKAKTLNSASLAGGQTLAAGTMLLGQIRQADASSLSVVFDQADVDGHQVPIKLTLVAAALLEGQRMMSDGHPNSKMESPSGSSAPNDHPLNGGRYIVTEAGNSAMNGVNHESLAEINKPGVNSSVDSRSQVAAHAGSVIGMPGTTLVVEDGAPYASEFKSNGKDLALPRGIQLMFAAR